MKRAFLGLLVGLALVSGVLLPGALACGEKGIMLVDSLERGGNVQMEKSACTKSFFPSNGDQFLLEKSKVKVTSHQAKHILSDYLLQEYGPDAEITNDNVQVPGHEHHNHGHGNPQLSHGHYTWTFNVIAPGKMDGKAFPMYVDMETGVVYGIGCGLGAGAVVFTPDISRYPDSDISDVNYHAGLSSPPTGTIVAATAGNPFSSFTRFILALFGLA